MPLALVRIPRFTTLQLLLGAALVALLLGLFTSSWRAGTPHRVVHICFSPNGKHLAALYSNGAVRVWRLHQGRARLVVEDFARIPPSRHFFDAMFFLEDERLVKLESTYPALEKTNVRQIELSTGKVTDVMQIDADFVLQSYVAAAGARLYIPQWDTATIRCFDLNKRQLVRKFVIGNEPVRTLNISSDGSTLAATDRVGTVRVVDTATGEILSKREDCKIGTAVLTADGSRLAVFRASPDFNDFEAKVTILDTHADTSDELLTGLMNIYWVATSKDGSRLVVAGEGGFVESYDLAAKRRLGRSAPRGDLGIVIPFVQFLMTDSAWHSGNALHPDGKSMASYLQDVVVVQNVATGEVFQVIGGSARLVPMANFIAGFAIWAVAWGIVRKRDRNAALRAQQLTQSPAIFARLKPPIGLRLCRGMMVVGGLIALTIPVGLMFLNGPALFPTVYFSLFVGLAAVARGAARDTEGLHRTTTFQAMNLVACDPVNFILAIMQLALLRRFSVRNYLDQAK
jgi:WD40 repeat protein